MAFNYDVLTENSGAMKTTSDTFAKNCIDMNLLIQEDVGDKTVWYGDSAVRFSKDWEEFSSDFPTYKQTFESQIETLNSAIDAYNKAESK